MYSASDISPEWRLLGISVLSLVSVHSAKNSNNFDETTAIKKPTHTE